MKTSKLTGLALDWAVAKCEGRCLGIMTAKEQAERFDLSDLGDRALEAYLTALGPKLCSIDPEDGYKAQLHNANSASYSSSWALAGPIIERERIAVRAYDHDAQAWSAELSISTTQARPSFRTGRTPLIAAMRCYVASKLGDTVDVPEELL